eukprot:gene25052-16335_t
MIAANDQGSGIEPEPEPTAAVVEESGGGLRGAADGILDEPEEAGGEAPVIQSTAEYRNEVTGELGGPRGPEPTRYGDWEQKGRCSDF